MGTPIVVEEDGSPIPPCQQIEQDTIDIGSAECYTVELETDVDSGVDPFHCHRLDHTHTTARWSAG